MGLIRVDFRGYFLLFSDILQKFTLFYAILRYFTLIFDSIISYLRFPFRRKRRVFFRRSDLSAGASQGAKEAREAKENTGARHEKSVRALFPRVTPRLRWVLYVRVFSCFVFWMSPDPL